MRFGQRPQHGALARQYHAAGPAPDPARSASAGNGTESDTDTFGNPDDPTVELEPEPDEPPVYGPSLPSESTIHVILDLAMRIGEIQMASGAGAADATATILAVSTTYGLRGCEVDVLFTSISVCYHRGTELAPIYSLRVVRPRGTDYTRLVQVEELVRHITDGRLRATDAIVELDRIISTPHRYSRWAITGAWAGMAASIAVLIGGDLLVASISALIAALIDRVGRRLNQGGLPFFFQQLVGGILATGIALGISYSRLFAPEDQPSSTLLIAAALTVLLSGLGVVSTAQDAVTGYYLTAAGRTVEIVLSSVGLIAGVVLALQIAVQLGLPNAALAESLPASPWLLPVRVLAGACAAAFFALAAHAGPRVSLVAGVAGALGALAYDSLDYVSGSIVARAGIAALLIGFGGGMLARKLRLPPVVVAVSGLVPLLPGYSTYQALYQLAVVREPAGLSSLTAAIGIALALGAGVVFGQFLAQPLRTGLGRLGRRVAGPRMAGPLRPSRRKLE